MRAAPILSRRPSVLGFTLIELMVVLAVLAILIAIATPSFREVALNSRSTGHINSLLADLSLARSEAVKRAGTVTVATSGLGWSDGWSVFIDQDGDGVFDEDDDEQLKQVDPINSAGVSDANSFTLSAVSGSATGATSITRVTFGATGQTVAPADGARFGLCRPDEDVVKSTGIRVEPSGRAQSVKNLSGVAMSCS